MPGITNERRATLYQHGHRRGCWGQHEKPVGLSEQYKHQSALHVVPRRGRRTSLGWLSRRASSRGAWYGPRWRATTGGPPRLCAAGQVREAGQGSAVGGRFCWIRCARIACLRPPCIALPWTLAWPPRALWASSQPFRSKFGHCPAHTDLSILVPAPLMALLPQLSAALASGITPLWRPCRRCCCSAARGWRAARRA